VSYFYLLFVKIAKEETTIQKIGKLHLRPVFVDQCNKCPILHFYRMGRFCSQWDFRDVSII